MWIYERRLQYPVNIRKSNGQFAQLLISQFGGPNSETLAALTYLSQRYSFSDHRLVGLLTDIGTEELAHAEVISSMIYQLTYNLTPDEIVSSGFDKYYTDHTLGIWPQSAGGTPFNGYNIACSGDPLTDLYSDMAAEQTARTTYENLLRVTYNDEIAEPLRFLRQREIVHFQRFGEGLRIIEDSLNHKNFYSFNPSIDTNNC